MTPGEVVGEALRTRRLRDGWTAEQAAAHAKISYPTWRRLERGQPVRRGNMDKIDELYGLPDGATARAVDDAEIAGRFAVKLNPRDVAVLDAPPGGLALRGGGSMSGAVLDGVVQRPDAQASLPDISGGPEQVRTQLRHLAAQVQLLSAVVAQTRRLVEAQPPGATPDDVRGALTALEYVSAAAQAPLFRASTTPDENELAERLADDARRGQASTG